MTTSHPGSKIDELLATLTVATAGDRRDARELSS